MNKFPTFLFKAKNLIGIVIILLLANISAECNENQIDINSASEEELDKITNIGPVIAGRIIEERPFDSVDDLLGVKGIGNVTLMEIKQQGLACTGKKDSSQEADSEVQREETIEENIEENLMEKVVSTQELTSITLNSKSIKSKESTEFLSKNLAFFGVIAFCVIFGALFLIKKRKYKNEFN